MAGEEDDAAKGGEGWMERIGSNWNSLSGFVVRAPGAQPSLGLGATWQARQGKCGLTRLVDGAAPSPSPQAFPKCGGHSSYRLLWWQWGQQRLPRSALLVQLCALIAGA